MKKITLLLMMLGVITYTTNLKAQTNYISSMNGGTPYLSTESFAGYDWSGVGNHSFNNTNSSAITFEITDFDESNPEVGAELYIKLLRVGFGHGALNWGSDNETLLKTISAADFTNGAATVTVSLPSGTLPVGQTVDYESGYLWVIQVAGANGGGKTYINYVSNIEEEIVLSSKDFNKNKLGAFYNSNIDAIVMDQTLSGDYAIYDLSGRAITKGLISSEISTSSLKGGMYILSTQEGVLKFVK
ncbi:hypothetical protein KO493_14850 [Tamlana agarivorans]|uniref:Uncharacterized protein n=1 Tax=Pseudotamlana agarivorans TaxID=481183 RepID=A0ACC5UCC5_9FLAO|nr:hypothetical protein [Tamlana agarivorans]MBU2951977.1 hypothetical protein [Tamlana agarivorans]